MSEPAIRPNVAAAVQTVVAPFPNTNSYCKLACSKLIGLGNIGRMPLTERTSVLSVVTDA